MTNTLLIWEEVPEATRLFLIPNDIITLEQNKFLREAHGKFVNNDPMNDGMDFLNAAVTKREHKVTKADCIGPSNGFIPPSELFFANQCAWAEFEVPKENMMNLKEGGEITRVCLSGFLL